MTRRADPDGIYHARRAAMVRRLADEAGLEDREAHAWIDRWEDEAATLGLDRHTRRFWEEADRWIAEQRRRGKRPVEPKSDMSAEAKDGQVYGG
jgi:hypothetical protein